MLETDEKIADPKIKQEKKVATDNVDAKINSYIKKAEEKNEDAASAEPEDIKGEEEEEYEKPESFKGIHEELSWMTLPVRDEPYQPDENETPYLLDEELFFDNVIPQGGTQLLTDRPWFIDFFAPWCGHCQRLAPIWDNFHELHQKDLNIGKVDCTTESGGRLCKLFKVPGYPTLLYFPVTDSHDKDTIGYWDYTGGRTMEALEAVALQGGWKFGQHRQFPGQVGAQEKWNSMYGHQFGSLI